MKKFLMLVILFSTSAFAQSRQPDIMLYRKLGSPNLLQKRVDYGFAIISEAAKFIPATLALSEDLANLKKNPFSEPDKKALLCVMVGMLAQQIGSEITLYTNDSSGWATDVQQSTGKVVETKISEAVTYCGLAGGPSEQPATSSEEVLSRVQQIAESCDSVLQYLK